MKLLTLAALLLIATLMPAVAQDEDDSTSLDDTPHITIVGVASAEAPPDIATISLGVRSHKPQASAAADTVAVAARAVVDAAKAKGIKDADIATQSINLSETFDEVRDPQGNIMRRKPSGFDASNTIAIRTSDLAKAGELVQTLIDKGANSFDGIAFAVERPQPIYDRLASEAASNARRQAEQVVKAAGSKLGRVLLIESPDAETPSLSRRRAAPMLAKAATISEMPVEPGTTSFQLQMRVTWALEK